MGFRLIVSEAPDLTTIRVVGRLGDDAVAPLRDGCGRVQRPLVLDLSELTSASEAGVLLLRRLAREGVHLLAVPPYIALLLAEPAGELSAASPRRRPGRPPRRSMTTGRRSGHGR